MATANLVTPLFINNIGPWGLLLIVVVVLVLFGRGKVAGLMGEFGKGITAFKRGVSDGAEELENQRQQSADAARDVTPASNGENTRDKA
ncbi:MAG: twin-arginine translocase TatA/TatE family subunit [Pararhodobacter sp.]|nr:twin-arginine translocase TatA/TatE family subunit [Pararhodobacter sp.]